MYRFLLWLVPTVEKFPRRRPHSSLGGQTPDQAYFNQTTPMPVKEEITIGGNLEPVSASSEITRSVRGAALH